MTLPTKQEAERAAKFVSEREHCWRTSHEYDSSSHSLADLLFRERAAARDEGEALGYERGRTETLNAIRDGAADPRLELADRDAQIVTLTARVAELEQSSAHWEHQYDDVNRTVDGVITQRDALQSRYDALVQAAEQFLVFTQIRSDAEVSHRWPALYAALCRELARTKEGKL